MEENKKSLGRPRNFKTPEDLKKAWDHYKTDLKEQAESWPKVQYVGKDGVRVEDYPVLPLTMEGFEVFCIDNYGYVHQYFTNQDDGYQDFLPICSRIKKEIRNQQITGGMLGMFNPSITQRLNNLKEATETNVNGVIYNANLTAEEAKKKAEELDDEY